MNQLRDCVGKPPRAHVVDGQDRVAVAEPGARVDDLLGTALHLRVVALDGSEIELLSMAVFVDPGGAVA